MVEPALIAHNMAVQRVSGHSSRKLRDTMWKRKEMRRKKPKAAIWTPRPIWRTLKPVLMFDGLVEVARTPPRIWMKKARTSQRTNTSAVMRRIS